MSHCFQTVARACFFSGVLLLLAIRLSAAPDPDLFDGRVVFSPPQPSESGGSEEASEPAEPSADGGSEEPFSESRDYGSVGEVGGGESVESESSKASAAVGGGGGAPIPPDAVPGSGTSSGGSGTPIAETSGGSGSGAASIEHSFEDFGFGSISGLNSTVAVNRSKDVAESSSTASIATIPPDSSTSNSISGAGSSAPATSRASGDYGSNLPSGL